MPVEEEEFFRRERTKEGEAFEDRMEGGVLEYTVGFYDGSKRVSVVCVQRMTFLKKLRERKRNYVFRDNRG